MLKPFEVTVILSYRSLCYHRVCADKSWELVRNRACCAVNISDVPQSTIPSIFTTLPFFRHWRFIWTQSSRGKWPPTK